MACATANLCVVGDDAGYVLSATDPTGGAKAWTGAAIDIAGGTHHAISGLSCPSAALCVAVDDAGGILTTTDPTGPASGWSRVAVDASSPFTGVSCASASSCVAIDKSGAAWRTESPTGGAAAWVSTRTGAGGALTAVSCPTETFCAAVDAGGDVLTDTAPSTNWRATNLTSQALDAVSCASATLCVAGGTGTGALVSTTPAGGAAAWQATRITDLSGGPETVTAVACSAASSCVAGTTDGIYATDDPTAGPWSDEDNAEEFDPIAVSCAPGGGCAGVDGDGDFGGLTASGVSVAQIEDGGTDLAGVSCPQAGRCFVDDDDGLILASTDPTGGSTSWSASSLLPRPQQGSGDQPYGLACPSVSLCLTGIGYVQRGDAGETGPESGAVTTQPTGMAPWKLFGLPHHSGFSGVSCTSASLCAVVDDRGTLYLSRHPSEPQSWSPVTGSGPDKAVYCPHQGRCLGPGTSCPTRAFCALISDAKGTIASSTAPARPGARWTTITIDPGHPVTGLSCPTAGLCYAVDGRGTVLVSTHPTAASSWSVADQAGIALNGIACPTNRACIAVGDDGAVITAS